MPPLLLEMLRDAIAKQPDMEIADARASADDLTALVERVGADILVLKRDRPTKRDGYNAALFRRPHLRILEIVDQGRRGLLYELRPARIALGEISPQRLLDAIRSSRWRKRAAMHA
jgi:hypothetical protein